MPSKFRELKASFSVRAVSGLPFIMAGTVFLSALISTPVRAAVVFSEDFSGGNPANSSDYTLVNSGTQTGQLDYRIVNNPSTSFTNGYDSYFDHTLGTASGAMLFFDGSSNASNRIFYRSANLTVGTTYTFSYWGSAADNENVPTLQAQVDGAPLGTPQTVSDASWQQFSVNYTPTSGTSHVFSIVDTNTIALGNDGALDDISLVPEPASMLLSIPFIFGLMRRRAGRLPTGKARRLLNIR